MTPSDYIQVCRGYNLMNGKILCSKIIEVLNILNSYLKQSFPNCTYEITKKKITLFFKNNTFYIIEYVTYYITNFYKIS